MKGFETYLIEAIQGIFVPGEDYRPAMKGFETRALTSITWILVIR